MAVCLCALAFDEPRMRALAQCALSGAARDASLNMCTCKYVLAHCFP